MPSLLLLWVALLLAARAAVVRADNDTLAVIYPSATPTINYVDSIEVVFISTFKYPTILAGCDVFNWQYFVDVAMADDATEGSATFTALGQNYLNDSATNAFPWSCTISLYPNSVSSSIDTTYIGGYFVISSLSGQRAVIYEESTTAVVSDVSTSSASSLVQATTTLYVSSNSTTSTASSTASTSSAASSSKSGLSSGAKAGIAVGCVLGTAVVAGLFAAIFFVRRRIRANEQRLEELQMQQQQQQQQQQHGSAANYDPVGSPPDGSVAMASVYNPKIQISPQQVPNLGIYATVPELPAETVPRYEMGSDQPKPPSPYHD